MKDNRSKKLFLLISTYLILLFVPKIKNNSKEIKYNEEYVYESTIPYASYSNGNVYIVDEDTFKTLDKDSNDIYIIDSRNAKDSDMAIYNSYKITSDKEMNEILDIIMNYENNYPSNWDRTYESLKNEWDVHNICYYLDINRNSTTNVNLNNADQDKYNSKVLTFFLDN